MNPSYLTRYVFLAAACALPAMAQISYPTFSSSAGLQLNGNAAVTSGVLRLTPAAFNQAGSAFSTSAIPLASNASFSTFFQFRITNSGGIIDTDGTGADGIVFVVQTVANNVGGLGGGIGYLGIPKSVGIEYDTWNNGTGYGDPDGNHVNVDFSGSFSSASDAVSIATRMNDGGVWSSWIDYNGATGLLEVRLAENSDTRPGAALISQTVDLATVLGSTNAFVGFTSGTGAAYGDHDILSWEFRNSFDPISGPGIPPVPEPATYGACGAALLGLAMCWRRRRRAK